MAEPSTEPALKIDGVSHAFGARKALRDVSLTVPRGAFVALLGPNGAGKTTLFNLVTRLYANRSGSISVLGFDVRRQSMPALARLGVVFQSRAIDSDLSVAANLSYHAALHGIGRGEAKRRSMALLSRVGLADRARDRVRTLSGGQLRRVEIVRAMLHAPSLLLLDEATVGLDVESRRQILAAVKALVHEDGVGVLWATHLIDEVEDADGVVVLHQGAVLARGTVAEIIAAAAGRTPAGAAAPLDLEAAFVALTKTRPALEATP